MTNLHKAKVLNFSYIEELQNSKEYQYDYTQDKQYNNSYFITISEFIDGVITKKSTVNIISEKNFVHNVVQYLYENCVSPFQIFDVLDDKAIKYVKPQ